MWPHSVCCYGGVAVAPPPETTLVFSAQFRSWFVCARLLTPSYTGMATTLAGGPYQPHFGVCRVMAMPRRQNVVVCPEEVAYEPKALSALAARVVSNADTPSTAIALPADLMELIDAQRIDGWLPYETKDRACTTLTGKLRVGEFALFADCDTRVLPHMFTVDLRTAATHVLRFIDCAHSVAAIWEPAALLQACTRRYRVFLEEQAKCPTVRYGHMQQLSQVN